jgi:transposase
LLNQHLQLIEHLEQTVTEFEAQIEAALNPFRAAVERLVTIPGVSTTAAHVIIAEIGVDMSRFATVGHLRSSVTKGWSATARYIWRSAFAARDTRRS